MFLCLWQVPWPYVALAARTGVDPGAVTSSIRSALAVAAPNLAMNHVESLRQIVDDQMTGDRFGMVLFAGFAGVALLLAALGIYGVMSFAVAQRTHEIGLRMALGAQKSEVVGLIVRGGDPDGAAGNGDWAGGGVRAGPVNAQHLVWSGLGGLCQHGAGGGGAVRGGAVCLLDSGAAFGPGGSHDCLAGRVRNQRKRADDEIKTSERGAGSRP